MDKYQRCSGVIYFSVGDQLWCFADQQKMRSRRAKNPLVRCIVGTHAPAQVHSLCSTLNVLAVGVIGGPNMCDAAELFIFQSVISCGVLLISKRCEAAAQRTRSIDASLARTHQRKCIAFVVR